MSFFDIVSMQESQLDMSECFSPLSKMNNFKMMEMNRTLKENKDQKKEIKKLDKNVKNLKET